MNENDRILRSITSVDPKDNTCRVYVEVEHDEVPLADFIANLQAAAEGLENPTVEVEGEQEGYDGFITCTVYVTARRPMIATEIAAWYAKYGRLHNLLTTPTIFDKE